MKQVRVHGAGDVRVDEVDEPSMGERDAIVAIGAVSVVPQDGRDG